MFVERTGTKYWSVIEISKGPSVKENTPARARARASASKGGIFREPLAHWNASGVKLYLAQVVSGRPGNTRVSSRTRLHTAEVFVDTRIELSRKLLRVVCFGSRRRVRNPRSGTFRDYTGKESSTECVEYRIEYFLVEFRTERVHRSFRIKTR